EQHVRVDAIYRRRIRAAALPRILVYVDPVAEEHVAELTLVVRSERRDRCWQPVEHLIVRILSIEIDEWNRRIVAVVRFEARDARVTPTTVECSLAGYLMSAVDKAA